jgi:hypothetical protein
VASKKTRASIRPPPAADRFVGQGARPADGDELVTTTVRIGRSQAAALRRVALEVQERRGTGKADASEVLRGILAAWMRTQA